MGGGRSWFVQAALGAVLLLGFAWVLWNLADSSYRGGLRLIALGVALLVVMLALGLGARRNRR